MEKKLIKSLVISLVVSLTIGLIGSFAFAASKELTPYDFSQLSRKKKLEYKTITIRIADYRYADSWTEEKDLPATVLPLKEAIDSGDIRTPLTWYSKALFELTHPKVKVINTEFKGWDRKAMESLMAELASGTAPAYYWIVGAPLPFYVEQGLAKDMTDVVKNWDQTPYLEKTYGNLWKSAGWREGRCYAIPATTAGTGGFRFRKDFFKEAGLFNEEGKPGPSTNWTWNDFREIAKKLTDPKKKRFGVGFRQVSPVPRGTDCLLSPYVFSQGFPIWGKWFVPDKTGEYRWRFVPEAVPQLKKALQFFHDMYWKDHSIMMGAASGHWISDEYFFNGREAMYMSNPDAPFYFWPVLSPHAFGPTVESKEIAGYALVPTGPYGIRPNNAYLDLLVFNPTLNKEEFQAAWDYFKWVMYGTGVDIRSQNMVYCAQYGLKSELNQGFFTYASPYNIKKSEAVKSYVEKHANMEVYAVRAAGFKVPREPNPESDYKLLINAGSGEPLRMMIQKAVAVTENPDYDKIMQETADYLNKKILTAKMGKGDKDKFKAYYTAMNNFYKRYYPKWYNSKEYKEQFEKYYKVW